MRVYFVLLLLLATGGAFAQEKRVKITAKFEHCPSDTLVQLFDPYTGEYFSTTIKNNSFGFDHPIPLGGCIYVLKIGTSNDEKAAIVFYLDEGELKITGKGPYFDGAKFTGSKWVSEWQEGFRIVDSKNPENKRMEELMTKYRAAADVGDEDVATELSRAINDGFKKRTENIMNFVKAHRHSGVSAYLLTCYFQGKNQIKKLLEENLDEKGLSSRIATRFLYPGKYEPHPKRVEIKLNDPDSTAANDPVAIGKPAPDFTVPDINGKTVSLADFKGKYVFLDFWASWCGPCVPQIPHLMAANEKFKNKNFVMIAVSLDDKRNAWTKAIEQHGMKVLNVSSLKGWSEPVALSYGVRAIPMNYLIGPDGKIVARAIYGENIEKTLNELIK